MLDISCSMYEPVASEAAYSLLAYNLAFSDKTGTTDLMLYDELYQLVLCSLFLPWVCDRSIQPSGRPLYRSVAGQYVQK